VKEIWRQKSNWPMANSKSNCREKSCGAHLFWFRRDRGKPREKSRWLLIKRKDAWANSKWSANAPALDRSVLSGRTLGEIEHSRSVKKKAA
jgi:hypothetical protein